MNEFQIKLDFIEYPLVSMAQHDTLIVKIQDDFFSEETRYKLISAEEDLKKELEIPR